MDVKYSTNSSISISKRVDCFKLIMKHGHLNQRINLLLIMQVIFPVAQQFLKQLLSLWGRVNDFLGSLIGQCRTRNSPDVHFHILQLRAYDVRSVEVQWPPRYFVKPRKQGRSVTNSFFCRRIGLVFGLNITKQLICSCYDIFNLRAVLGFQ